MECLKDDTVIKTAFNAAWKDGEITQQEYREMKADYERQAAGLSDLLARLTAERKQLSNGVDQQHPALIAFAKYQNIEKLTPRQSTKSLWQCVFLIKRNLRKGSLPY